MSRRAVVFVVAVVVVGIALVADAVLAAPLFLSNDGPHHIFSAWGRAHIDDPGLGYAKYFTGNFPPSANGVADLFTALAPALGWRQAHQAVVVVIAVIWLVGCVTLASAFDKKRALVGLMSGAACLGWNLYLGFFEFALASGLGFFVLALALDARTPGKRVAVGALLLLTSLVHFFAAALVGLCVAVAWMARSGASSRKRELLWILVCAPAAIPALLAAGAVGTLSDVDESAPLSIRLTALGACTLAGPSWRALFPAALALVSLVILVVTRAKRTRTELSLGAVAGAFVLVPLVIPWSVFGWQDVASRPAPLALAVLVALLPVELLSTRLLTAAGASAAVFFLCATLWARDLDVTAANEADDVIRVLDHAPTNTGYRWPFFLVSLDVEKDAHIVRWDPERGLGSLFALVQGGFVAHSHVVSPQAHTLLLKPEVSEQLPKPLTRSRFVTPIRGLADVDKRARALDVLMSHAVQVDGVIVVERPEDHVLWQQRGYRVDVEDGRVLLAHFVGCSLQVDVDHPRSVTTSVSPVAPDDLKRTDVVDGPSALEHLPCGPLVVDGCAPDVVTLASDSVPSVRCP